MNDNPYVYEGQAGYDPNQLSSDVRNWAMLCHLVAALAMPFGLGHIVAPLIVWLLKRE